MKKINALMAATFFYTSSALAAKPIIVAVIDTGVSAELMNSGILCKYGNRDFTDTSLIDTNGHGTHISGLIDQYAKNLILDEGASLSDLQTKKINYCQVALKFFDANSKIKSSSESLTKALRWAIDIKVDVINISAGGPEFILEEKLLIKEALDHKIKVVLAGGNEHCELGNTSYIPFVNKIRTCTYYPAMYDPRAIVVGNALKDGERAPSSNYGYYINDWEWGTDRASYGHNMSGLARLTGTSQATAIKTGKIIRDALSSGSPR